MMARVSRKARVFWPVLLTVFLADCTTKQLAVEHLSPPGTSHEVLGETLRLTLAYNVGAAMGLPVGGLGAAALGLISILVASLIFVGYARSKRNDRLLAGALALVLAGAVGNGWQRLFSARGVVDFIDLGWGLHRFYVFNVADIGISAGALLLAAWFWREDRTESPPLPGGGTM